MRQITLNQAIVSVAVAAMLPIVIFGLLQSVANRRYAQAVISERLVENAASTAAAQHEAFALAQNMLASQALNPDVINVTSNCAQTLARSLRGQRAIINLTRVGADSFAKCSAIPFGQPVQYGDQPWWRDAMTRRRLTIGGPTFGKITQRYVLAAILPLYKGDGSLNGSVSAAIDASWLEKALAARKISADSVVSVVDATGKIIFTTGNDKLARFDPATFGRVSSLKLNDGSNMLYASAPLFEKQLHVVYAEPEALLMSPFRDQTRQALMLPLLTILATCLAIWIAMNRFVIRWLRRLTGVARQIATGDYASAPGQFDHAPQEIAELGSTMTTMSQAISDRDEALRTSAEENHAMAREVNHRVKNNLQMVMSLLDLQSLRLTDEQARNVLMQTRMRMGAIALVHRILYDFGEQSDFGKVDMDRLTGELCAQLRNAQAGPVTHECHSEVGMIPVDTALPICLFMVEAVTNAYRHGFKAQTAGAIITSLTGDLSSGVLKVSDNGAGLRNETPASAIGRQLMQAYASQLNGEYSMSETPGGGVTVELTYAAR